MSFRKTHHLKFFRKRMSNGTAITILRVHAFATPFPLKTTGYILSSLRMISLSFIFPGWDGSSILVKFWGSLGLYFDFFMSISQLWFLFFSSGESWFSIQPGWSVFFPRWTCSNSCCGYLIWHKSDTTSFRKTHHLKFIWTRMSDGTASTISRVHAFAAPLPS